MRDKKIIKAVILSLVFLDLVLSIWGFFFPELWYSFFHNSVYIDPQALLKRCSGNWAAFFILQVIAFFKWEKSLWWLILVAGCRLGDSLTDITCLIFSQNISVFGMLAFPAAGLGNIIIGIFLIQSYTRINGKTT